MAGHTFADLPPGTVLLGRASGARLVEGRCAPIHDPESRAIGAVLVLRDVTQRARLEAELQRASRLESIGLLAGGIAHDFNNLLTVVMGNLALAALDAPSGGLAARWVREAELGLARARDLTRQLLTFAKGGEPVLEAVNFAEIVRETAGFTLHGSNVRSVLDLAPDLRAAKADKGQLSQVVQNLVLNAAQAMPDGGIVGIKVRNERLRPDPAGPLAAGDYLRLEISDTGVGIAPENLPRVFEPYFTTKPAGNGLGLATVYSIVRRHHGRIEVESEPGRGTTFRCWLPAAAEPATGKADAAPASVAAPGGAGRLLFMDDEEPIRMMAEALLGRLGFTVRTAPDGEEVLRLYAEARAAGSPFDLVIMDLTVPGRMGGKETMAHLLKLDPNVKAIVSSGYSSDPVMANHREHGFRGMVPKPYKLSDLAKVVRAVLAEKA
jgi:signal transduction histidine kinase/ActR/RegA family two-component response regulator